MLNTSSTINRWSWERVYHFYCIQWSHSWMNTFDVSYPTIYFEFVLILWLSKKKKQKKCVNSLCFLAPQTPIFLVPLAWDTWHKLSGIMVKRTVTLACIMYSVYSLSLAIPFSAFRLRSSVYSLADKMSW